MNVKNSTFNDNIASSITFKLHLWKSVQYIHMPARSKDNTETCLHKANINILPDAIECI